METTDVTVDASSTPADALPNFETMSHSDLVKWKQTGDLPKQATETETSDATGDPEKDASEDESGVVPETTKKETEQQEPDPKEHTNRRMRRLAAQVKALEAELAKARDTKPAEVRQETKADAKKAPKLQDFSAATPEEAVDKWEEALHAYYRETLSESVKEAIRVEREAAKQAETQTEAEKATEKLTNTFVKRSQDYRKTLKEDNFSEHFVDVKEFCEEGNLGFLADAILESEVGPQLITYFGENFDELEKFGQMTMNAALREIGRLEVSEKIKGPAPKTRTAAKKIGSQVDGRTAVSDEDEAIEKAALSGNAREYNRLMNKREAAENSR